MLCNFLYLPIYLLTRFHKNKSFDSFPFSILQEIAGTDASEHQLFVAQHAVSKVKETISRLASEHRELHSSVSKVGKTIDRVRFSIIPLYIYTEYVFSCSFLTNCRILLKTTHLLLLIMFSLVVRKKDCSIK